MNYFQYVRALPILAQLARRRNPEAYGWIKAQHQIMYGTDILLDAECFICGEKLLTNGQRVMDHAYQHLKEYNLLPFL